MLGTLTVADPEQAALRAEAQFRVADNMTDAQRQAVSRSLGTPEFVQQLMQHPDFNLDNPNRVRALIGTFASGNFAGFHAADGAGYVLVADAVIGLDRKNPQIAARIVRAFNSWRTLEPRRRALMEAELTRIAARPQLSKDVFEIVSRALETQVATT